MHYTICTTWGDPGVSGDSEKETCVINEDLIVENRHLRDALREATKSRAKIYSRAMEVFKAEMEENARLRIACHRLLTENERLKLEYGGDFMSDCELELEGGE